MSARGWYCYEIRRKPGDKDYIGTCRRSERACEVMRQSVEHLDAHITPCTYREKASCFRVEDKLEGETYMSCHSEYMHCVGAWGDLKELNLEHMRLGRCQEDIE